MECVFKKYLIIKAYVSDKSKRISKPKRVLEEASKARSFLITGKHVIKWMLKK
jgi:hypothetical protein